MEQVVRLGIRFGQQLQCGLLRDPDIYVVRDFCQASGGVAGR